MRKSVRMTTALYTSIADCVKNHTTASHIDPNNMQIILDTSIAASLQDHDGVPIFCRWRPCQTDIYQVGITRLIQKELETLKTVCGIRRGFLTLMADQLGEIPQKQRRSYGHLLAKVMAPLGGINRLSTADRSCIYAGMYQASNEKYTLVITEDNAIGQAIHALGIYDSQYKEYLNASPLSRNSYRLPNANMFTTKQH